MSVILLFDQGHLGFDGGDPFRLALDDAPAFPGGGPCDYVLFRTSGGANVDLRARCVGTQWG
jgi:hypothetical protein